jgi:hypothetical protein
MNKLHNLIGIIKGMDQQIDFIEHCRLMGMCTDGQALDATISLKEEVDKAWEEELMGEQIKDNLYQGISNN